MNTESDNKERALLAGLNTGDPNTDFSHSMEELAALANACNIEVGGIYTQNLPVPNPATYIGSGKIEEIRNGLSILEADLVIFDDALSPIQLRNLTDALNCSVLDRTSLILRIFADRAKTKEAMLQVELAGLQYMLPRLVGMHASLSRQGGTSGSFSNKGSGEKKLELDRRHIEHRINELQKNLREVKKERATTRKQRESSGLKKVALVGYTNAGKSTIMNWMIDTFSDCDEKKVLEKDMLFATLDTTIRKISPGNKRPPFLLSDTVGFINQLPHTLIKAFHSTLEEVSYADLILHVIDSSDCHCDEQIRVTEHTLLELDAASIPCIYLYNKADISRGKSHIPYAVGDKLYISAKERIGMEELLSMLYDKLSAQDKEHEFLFPLSRGDILNTLFERATVHSYEYRENGIFCKCKCSEKEFCKFNQYSVKD